MPRIAEADDVVRESLADFFEYIRASRWRGREREAISLYAFGSLQQRFRAGGVLHDPRQIGIEVAVPGLAATNMKRQVCKDLVLWAEPGMTCWDVTGAATRSPLAILEWKVRRPEGRGSGESSGDLDWLTSFSTCQPDFVGFAVALSFGPQNALTVDRAAGGRVQTGWLRLQG